MTTSAPQQSQSSSSSRTAVRTTGTGEGFLRFGVCLWCGCRERILDDDDRGLRGRCFRCRQDLDGPLESERVAPPRPRGSHCRHRASGVAPGVDRRRRPSSAYEAGDGPSPSGRARNDGRERRGRPSPSALLEPRSDHYRPLHSADGRRIVHPPCTGGMAAADCPVHRPQRRWRRRPREPREVARRVRLSEEHRREANCSACREAPRHRQSVCIDTVRW